MPLTDYRRSFLIKASLSLASVSLAGCGTILYPERIGQMRGGPIDWKVAALDGLGLLLFFIPGVIAFAVDFHNGTIFLPTCYYGQLDSERTDELLAVNIDKHNLSQQKVETVVSNHIDQPVVLAPGKYRTNHLPAIDKFWDVAGTMRSSLS